jgi:hypothetical protein
MGEPRRKSVFLITGNQRTKRGRRGHECGTATADPLQKIAPRTSHSSSPVALLRGSLTHLSSRRRRASPQIRRCYTREMFEICAQDRRICLIFVLLLIAAGVGAGVGSAQVRAAGVVDLDGRAVDPFQRAAGKIVVLLFVRTDCPVSNRYAPTIREMSTRFEKSIEFFLVYPIASETSEVIRKHLKEYGYKLTALRDPQRALVRAANASVTPESAVFSASGQLLYHGRIDDWYTELGRSRPAPTTHELSSAVQAARLGKRVAVATAPAVGCFLPGAP